MRWFVILTFLAAGISFGAQAQYVKQGPVSDISDIVGDAEVYCEGLQFFRRNYDGLTVDQSLYAVREIKEAGANIRSGISRMDTVTTIGKSTLKQLKKIEKNINAIDNSLEKLTEYIEAQNYKSKSSEPGGHSPIETRYFRMISESVKDIRYAVQLID
jgi:hypothetical protein